MATVAVASLRPDVDLEQASHHLEVLHAGAPGFGSLVLLGNDRHERHAFFETQTLTDDPSIASQSREALQDVVDARWNVYVALSTFAQAPNRGRGTRADVLTVPGVWADLDVKPDTEGYYRNEYELMSYVQYLPRPTLEITTGSGGRHLYWLTHERLEADHGQRLLLAWLDFLRAEAGTNIIENVHDTTRILRLAGTVRWPKVADAQMAMPQPVTLVDEGPRYPVGELELVSRAAHQEAKTRRDELRALRADAQHRRETHLITHGLELANYYRITRMFNEQQDWKSLLEATGWTLHSEVSNCRYWTRPNKQVSDGKSASTDFINEKGEVSNMMTIYSRDEYVFPDLWENSGTLDAVGVCSKFRFALVKLFDGDVSKLLRVIVLGGGRL